MLRLVCAVTLLAAVVTAFDAPTLIGTFTLLGSPGKGGFYTIPRTDSEATEAGWVRPGETLNDKLFTTWCEKDDPRICLLTDKKGSSAGYQISISKKVDDLNVEGINLSKQGFKSLTLFGQPVYANQIFFVPQNVLAEGGRDWNNQTGTGLWLNDGTDELFEVPLNEDKMSGTPFVKQKCFTKMGQHYFWKVSPALTQDDFEPWFTLHDHNGDLTGFGFITFGTAADKVDGEDTRTQWMENPPLAAIYAIAPDVPEFIKDYSEKYGILSHHGYFVEKPWEIRCSGFRTAYNVVKGFFKSIFG